MKGKIQYHHRAKQMSVDKSTQEILNSSPVLEKKNKEFIIENKMKLDDADYFEAETSFKNTIQSMNEKDNVNYLIESNSQNDQIFKTAMKKNNQNMIVSTQQSEILFEDTDNNNYVESSNKMLETIKKTLDYFKKSQEILLKNEDKVPTVKLLKEDYEKMKLDHDTLLIENQKLKDKIKILKESSPRSNTDNVNISKFMDSLMYLQSKNEELEKENKFLKSENEDLIKKLKYEKRRFNESHQGRKLTSNKSQSALHSQNKMKQDQMELLLKEQITCMKKMLFIVQDGKETQKKRTAPIHNDYEAEESDIDSNIHFEESFNVTNISNSVDYTPDHDVMYILYALYIIEILPKKIMRIKRQVVTLKDLKFY
jgi:hypothetical protein